MKSKVVPVKNIARLAAAGEALIRRAPGMPGMGLVHGATGYGKTTAITWYAGRCNAVYVRALAVWTPASMMSTILKELGRNARGSCAQMMTDIIEALALSNRPLFIDEADYLVESKRMTESLRDVHDMATVPVVLIGMADIDQKLAHRQQLTGRLQQRVEFKPLDLEDTEAIARELCEVKIKSDLISQVFEQTKGAARLVVISLQRIEQSAKARGLDSVGVADWGKRELFTGDAPSVNAHKPVLSVVR